MRDLLLGLADHSPYLWRLIAENPGAPRSLASRPAGTSARRRLVAALGARRDDDEAELMRALRRAKRESALLIALADVGGVWDLIATTEALTRFADAAVVGGAAFSVAQKRAERAG